MVTDNGQQVASFTAAQVEAGDFAGDTTYATRGARDQTCGSSEPLSSGSSITQILSNANVSVPAKGSVDVSAAGAPEIELAGDDVGSGGAQQFYDGQIPVVYGNGSTQLSFIRGLYASPAPCPPDGPASGADSNTGSSGEIFDVAEIDVVVRSGPVLNVAVTPDPQTSCSAGVSCALTAVVSGAGSDAATYSYSWDFGDGSTITTTNPSVSHTYADPNDDYFPQVTVDGSDGSHGVGYGDVELATASQSTSPTTSSGPAGVGSQSPSAPPPTTSSPATATATPDNTASGSTTPSASATSTSVGSGAAVGATKASPTKRRREVGKPATGDRIAGRSIGDERGLTPVVIESDNDAASKPIVDADQGSSGLSIAFGIMVALLLIAAGAGREWRDRHRSG